MEIMKEITTYSDYFGKIFSLTDEELNWFHSFSVEKMSLVGVIAHEIAHTYQWRHCKRHQRIASELVEKIQAA